MKRSLLALTLLAALPFAASAQDAKSGLSYNYVQGGYVGTNTDGGDADGAPGADQVRVGGRHQWQHGDGRCR